MNSEKMSHNQIEPEQTRLHLTPFAFHMGETQMQTFCSLTAMYNLIYLFFFIQATCVPPSYLPIFHQRAKCFAAKAFEFGAF